MPRPWLAFITTTRFMRASPPSTVPRRPAVPKVEAGREAVGEVGEGRRVAGLGAGEHAFELGPGLGVGILVEEGAGLARGRSPATRGVRRTRRQTRSARRGRSASETHSWRACAPSPTRPRPSRVGTPGGGGEVPVGSAAHPRRAELEAQLARDRPRARRAPWRPGSARGAADRSLPRWRRSPGGRAALRPQRPFDALRLRRRPDPAVDRAARFPAPRWSGSARATVGVTVVPVSGA